MKRRIAVVLTLALLLTSMAFSVNAFGEDATASASAETPAAAPAPVKAPAAPAAVTSTADADGVYTVVAGNVMWKIAQQHNLTLDQLKALNPQIKNYNLIVPGQKIYVKAQASSASAPAAPVASSSATTKLYKGFGVTSVFRNGPGKDEEGNPVYSFSVVLASVTFDANGKITDAFIDGLEVATPNYDGASMPHFSGWPGKDGYVTFDHATNKLIEGTTPTVESATAEVSAWKTKRERGDAYGMNPSNDWYKQMNFYQEFFKGKTVAELDAWFEKNTTTAGRPIKADTTNAADLEKYNKLTAAEKAALADVVAGATMSLRDPHGDFLGAIEEAYKNRVEVK